MDKNSATHCWICEEPIESELDPEESIDLDLCHLSGQFLGWAHQKCNRARRYVNFTPVVGHNIQNYDLHQICLALNDCESTTTIKVILSTDEKYISMTFGVLIDTITTQEGRTQKIYEYLRFIDSYKMMNSSLEKLVEILPDTHFDIMKAMFPSVSESNAHLLKQKGYHPYSYVCDRTKFSGERLLPLSEWRNTLDGGKLAVSRENLSHANQMWKLLGCKTLQDYHDAYLKLDCALLACVIEFHRELSFRTYKLDCMHFYTLPNMAKEASLKICKANIELMTEREHLDMIEPAIRGGVTSVCKERHFVANNKNNLSEYQPSEESTFALCVDANNLWRCHADGHSTSGGIRL